MYLEYYRVLVASLKTWVHRHQLIILCVVGAVPPWLQDDPLEGSSEAAPQAEIGPSLQEFLKQSMFCVTSHCYNMGLRPKTNPKS